MHPIVEQPLGQGTLVIRKYLFDNGLAVILLADPGSSVIAYQTWLGVGSRHSLEGKSGLSHLVVHMLSYNDHYDRHIETAGGNCNATSWVDWTYYQNDIPSSELELVIRMESDRFYNVLFEPRQFETARQIQLSQRTLQVDDDEDGFMAERLYAAVFQNHPYRWPSLGLRQDIEQLTLEDVISFYRTYYAPNNVTLVLAGGIDEYQALELIRRYYGNIPRQSIPAELPAIEPEQLEERRQYYESPRMRRKVLIGYKGPPLLSSDHLALETLTHMMFTQHTSALSRKLVRERGWVHSLGGSLTPFHHNGLLEIGFQTEQGIRSTDVEAVIYDQFEELKYRVSEVDLERTKLHLLTSYWSGLQTAHGRAASLGERELCEDFRYLTLIPTLLRTLTPDDIQRVARKYLEPRFRTVVTVN